MPNFPIDLPIAYLKRASTGQRAPRPQLGELHVCQLGTISNRCFGKRFALLPKIVSFGAVAVGGLMSASDLKNLVTGPVALMPACNAPQALLATKTPHWP